MNKTILLTILLLGIVVVSGFAEDRRLTQVLLALEAPFRNTAGIEGERIDDFRAEFSQQAHIASIDRTQQGSGSVSFKFVRNAETTDPGSKFRWEYRKPTIQEIVSDGQTLWYYLPENRQVIESDMQQVSAQQGENPVTFLSGLGNLSRDFTVRWASPEKDERGNPVLELRPRQNSQYIARLEVVVAREALELLNSEGRVGSVFPIVMTTVIDPSGNRTAISFQEVEINQGLSDELFRFQRPEGVEVVHPGEQGLDF